MGLRKMKQNNPVLERSELKIDVVETVGVGTGNQ